MNVVKMMSGRMTFVSGMPAAFMAISSKRSPKLPNVIREASNTARGAEVGQRASAE